MGLKRKLFYATLFASSCLLSTNIVKADTVINNDESTVSQSIATTADKEATEPATDKTSDAATATTDESKGEQEPVQTTTQTQIRDFQTSNDTTANPSQVQSQPVDGVYNVGGQLTYLHRADGSQITDRALGPNTAWYTDTHMTMSDGNNYYRVATDEFANGNNGTFTSYVQSYQGNATVVYQKGSNAHTFLHYGNKATYQGNNVPTGSTWKVSNYAKVNGKEWYEIGNDTWVPQDYVVINNGQYKDSKWISGVPLIAQRPELPNGCEITAVTMMLQYAGAKVNKMQMAREMPRSSNPSYGYIGQPWDQTGITIFPSALMNLVEKYAGTAKDLTGQNFDAIKYQIDIGHPVVTWHTLYGFPYHALVVTGYDPNYVYYNDCWTDQTLQMGINQFINNWNTQNRRAISY
ncbi:C39 family peptidase [Companilactobacillus huachuanensis]|uniref:C39 family peptidase n=1 Tax=Companilactobacillus huachuanensis TaxID=2559914 RepID=A0ABW1RLT9_9LACO|nr:C39 family peptidase [Companilactobacillus huachuanensis]